MRENGLCVYSSNEACGAVGMCDNGCGVVCGVYGCECCCGAFGD